MRSQPCDARSDGRRARVRALKKEASELSDALSANLNQRLTEPEVSDRASFVRLASSSPRAAADAASAVPSALVPGVEFAAPDAR